MSNMHKNKEQAKLIFHRSCLYVIDYYCLFAFWQSVILGQFPPCG